MLSGLPRSGSQVLSSILNQHPDIHSTVTSPIADLIGKIVPEWQQLSQSQLDPDIRQLHNILHGVIQGAYKHVDKNVIVDKNRLWPRYGKLVSNVLGEKPKIICTVRNITEILASYILLIEK